MERTETENLQSFTIDLTKKAQNIKKQIDNQELLLETIQYQANKNEEDFQKNRKFFADALIDLDGDKRNYLILGLILVIFVLIYILKL